MRPREAAARGRGAERAARRVLAGSSLRDVRVRYCSQGAAGSSRRNEGIERRRTRRGRRQGENPRRGRRTEPPNDAPPRAMAHAACDAMPHGHAPCAPLCSKRWKKSKDSTKTLIMPPQNDAARAHLTSPRTRHADAMHRAARRAWRGNARNGPRPRRREPERGHDKRRESPLRAHTDTIPRYP